MFIAAQFSGHKEIIFPEIFAIITGCCVAKRSPWNTAKYQIILLTTMSGTAGVLAVKYLALAIYWKILICLLFSEMLLVIFRTNFIPIIPAAIFPIFMNVHSFVYPTAVLILTSLIIFVQELLVKNKYRHQDKYFPKKINRTNDFKRYIKLFCLFGIISIAPMASGLIFLLSPPAVVTFVEIANPMSMNRHRPAKIWEVMFISSLIGAIFRFIFNIWLPLPLIVSALLACIVYFFYCRMENILYPPASGALIMPLILKPAGVLWYQLEVAIGLAVLIPVAIYLFNPPKPANNKI